VEGRLRKAAKIEAILLKYAGDQLRQSVCLDIGCSSGIVTCALAPLFDRIIGLDYDEIVLQNTQANTGCAASFIRGDAMSLPFPAGSLGVVVCAQVYEHVPDDRRLAAEIERVLKPGGVVFFSGPNWLFPLEPHYHLPFLHWLPGRLADACLRLLHRGDHYYERSRHLWGLRRLWGLFIIKDATLDVLALDLNSQDGGKCGRWLRGVPGWVWRALLPVFPNFNWVLVKPAAPGESPAR
jgi:SAM-dependent methyltransferase